ncbi:MAG: TRAP transporter substrate-binding protein [Rhodocyclaceae bacterium]
MNRRALLGSGLLAMLCAALPAAAQEPVVVRFSHVVARDTPKGLAADHFAALVNQRAAGRLRVEVYPDSQLYKDGEEMEALQLGSVQLLAPSHAKFGPLGVPDFEVFDLPFMFDSYAQLHRVTQGPIGKRLLHKLEAKGIVGLAYWDNGFKDFSANRPLRQLADFRGLRMRIQSSRVLDGQMRALGATPQVLAFSDTHRALAAGVVDGTENPPSNFYTQRMHEVQRYLLHSQHGYLGYVVIANKRFWEALPGDLRTLLEECMVSATRYANQIAEQKNNESLEAVRKSGKTVVAIPDPALRQALKLATSRTHREHEARIGANLIRSIYRETGFDPGRP